MNQHNVPSIADVVDELSLLFLIGVLIAVTSAFASLTGDLMLAMATTTAATDAGVQGIAFYALWICCKALAVLIVALYLVVYARWVGALWWFLRLPGSTTAKMRLRSDCVAVVRRSPPRRTVAIRRV